MTSKLLSPAIVWSALTGLIILLMQNISPIIPGDPAGYYSFVFNKSLEGEVFGVNTEWIYPVAAQIPIFLAGVIGNIAGSYLLGWTILVVLLNTIVIFIVSKNFKLSHLNLLYFSIMLLAISAIFYYRIDIIAIFLSVLALAFYTKNKNIAYFLLVVGTLIKIWPIAIIFGIWLMSNTKIKDIINVASFTIITMSPALLIGGINTAFSFVFKQNNRGVQMESLFALPSLIRGEKAFYNEETITYEVPLNGLEFISSLSNILLLASLLCVIIFGIVKFWKNPATLKQAFLLASIVIISFVLFNKVGSAQFSGWVILVIFIMGVIVKDKYKMYYALLGGLFVVMSGLLVPHFYNELITGEILGIVFLTIKHLSIALMMLIMVHSLIFYKDNQELAKKAN